MARIMRMSDNDIDRKFLEIRNCITSFDDVRVFGIFLKNDPHDFERGESERHGIKKLAMDALYSFWRRETFPEPVKWCKIKDALISIGKGQSVNDLGLDVLSGDVPTNNPPAPANVYHPLSYADAVGHQSFVGNRPAPPLMARIPVQPTPVQGPPGTVTSQPFLHDNTVHYNRSFPGAFGAGTNQHFDLDYSALVSQPFPNDGSGDARQPNTRVEEEQVMLHAATTLSVSPDLPQTIMVYSAAKNQQDLQTKIKTMMGNGQVHPIAVPIEYGLRALAEPEVNTGCDELLNLLTLRNASNNRVVIAVLDTGIYRDHQVLKDVIKDSKNFVKDQPVKGQPGVFLQYRQNSEEDLNYDLLNHGTLVAGLLTSYGPVNIDIYNYKVLPTGKIDRNDEGKITYVERPEGTVEDLADALKYIESLDHIPVDGNPRLLPVDIIIIAMGSKRTTPSLNEVLYRLSATKTIIAAAGNCGARAPNTVLWPAKHDTVISVGACTGFGKRLNMSAVGREIDFLCPGENIRSAGGIMLNGPNGESGYCATNGTSFAAPLAGAVAANVIAAAKSDVDRRNVTVNQNMRHILTKMCSNYDRYKPNTGYGILQPAKFFENDCQELHRIYIEVMQGS